MEKEDDGTVRFCESGFEDVHVEIADPADDAGPDALGPYGPGKRPRVIGGEAGHSNAR